MSAWLLDCLCREEVVGMCDKVGPSSHVVEDIIRVCRCIVVPYDGLDVVDHLLTANDTSVRGAPRNPTRRCAPRPLRSREVRIAERRVTIQP